MWAENTFVNRVLHKAAGLLLLGACIAWNGAGGAPGTPPLPAPAGAEPPSHWQGKPLRPLALGEVEQRAALRFPGSITRHTDGEQVLVLRHVERPTRQLHPAPDCYQGLGYRVAQARLEQDAGGSLWRCFEASRDGRRLRVCERIVDAAGQGFTDTSAWYLAAALGRSRGPWQAITVARPL